MLKSIITNLSSLRLTTSVTQVRGYLNRPKLRLPYWFVRKERVLHKNDITGENKEFIKQMVQETYGPPSLIKGVETYDQKVIFSKPTEETENKWHPSARRCGVIARKIGLYPLWTKNGERVRTTLLQIIDNHVIKYTPPEEFKPMQKPRVRNPKKFGCLLVGAESTDPTLLTKEYCAMFADSGVMPKRNLMRFLVTPDAALAPGTPLNVTHFNIGQAVDVRGLTKYRGFQGVIKRHGFKGMPASHGVTKTHRRPGNIGGGGEKGRVWPGTKMPGHMGNRWRKLCGQEILRINKKYNILWVKGCSVPGKINSLVYIFDTILPLRRPKTPPPFPTSFEDDLADDGPDDIWHEDMHDFKDETITFQPEA